MPNWRAIRTLTLWALAADPSDTQATAANSTAPHRARRKLRPVKAPSRPACFGSPAVRFRSGMLHPCIIFDPHRVAQVGTGVDGRGASLRSSVVAGLLAPIERIAFAPVSYDCWTHGRPSASRSRAPHHLFRPCRLPARRALRAAQDGDQVLRAADARRTRGADRRDR